MRPTAEPLAEAMPHAMASTFLHRAANLCAKQVAGEIGRKWAWKCLDESVADGFVPDGGVSPPLEVPWRHRYGTGKPEHDGGAGLGPSFLGQDICHKVAGGRVRSPSNRGPRAVPGLIIPLQRGSVGCVCWPARQQTGRPES